MNLRPELVEKKDPPIIIKISNIKDKFWGELSSDNPILEILLISDKRMTLKSWLKLKKIKNKNIKMIK